MSENVSSFARALAWVEQEVRRPVNVISIRRLPWSTTALLATGSRRFWFKQSPLRNARHEAWVLTRLTNPDSPAIAPDLFASNDGLGTQLTHEIAPPSRKASPREIATAMTEARRRCMHDRGPLPVVTIRTVAEEVVRLASDEAHHPSNAVSSLAVLLPRLEPKLDALDRQFDDVGLVHGDLHGENALATQDGVVILDWSDACWGSRVWDEANLAPKTSEHHFISALKQNFDLLTTPPPASWEAFSITEDRFRAFCDAAMSRLTSAAQDLRRPDA